MQSLESLDLKNEGNLRNWRANPNPKFLVRKIVQKCSKMMLRDYMFKNFRNIFGTRDEQFVLDPDKIT